MDYKVLSGQSPPNSASTTASRRGKFFLPLSNHGMPKTPLPTSPGNSIRSHRFHGLRSPRSPLSPGRDSLNSPLLSPPLSAKSCSTFIESEPSTPAYSPRAPSTSWDGATLIFLSPQPTPLLSPELTPPPSLPEEPEWEMMTPPRKTSNSSHKSTKQKVTVSRDRSFSVDDSRGGIARTTSLSSHPPTPLPRLNEKIFQDQSDQGKGKENIPPEDSNSPNENSNNNDNNTLLSSDDQSTNQASLNKFASRMKSMLRRKTVSERKTDQKRRVKEDLDRMESVHWTEM